MPKIPSVGRTRVLPLLLAVLAASGCDSADEIVLDADFYVGTWTLVRVADDSGDRTAQVTALLDDFAVDFESDGDFVLVADFAEIVNAAGQADVTLAGDYQAAAVARTLSLLIDTDAGRLAPTFRVEAESQNAATLTAPGAIVGQLLGDLQIAFDGDVVLGIARQ